MTAFKTERGFTAVPNDLLEAICSSELTGTEMRIVLAVIRHTYGYQRDSADMSGTFLSNATRVSKDFIAKCLRKLTADRVLTVHKAQTRTTPKRIGINPNFSQWKRRASVQISAKEADNGYTGIAQNDHTGVVQNDYTGVAQDDYTGVAQNDYTGVVQNNYTGVVQNDHTGVVQNDYTGVAQDGYTGVVQNDHQDINNNINNKNNNKQNNKERAYASEVAYVIELFNSVCKAYAPVMKMSDKLFDAVVILIKSFTKEEIERGFRMAEGSEFLKGMKTDWKASFLWLIDPFNMSKVLNGMYGGEGCDDGEDDEDEEAFHTYDVDDFFEAAVRASEIGFIKSEKGTTDVS